jgi:molybdopterin-containing oxidoreductase family membrane subunit
MMDSKRRIMGLFKTEDQVISAVKDLKASGYQFERVNIPFPSHKILDALELKKSRVGWFTLMGGLFGFCAGMGLAIYTALEWRLIVSGKPIIAIVPFIIVGFEATILFAVFGNVIGLLTQTRIPSFRWLKYYDARCSGDHFGVLASCKTEQLPDLKDFFRNRGGKIREFDSVESA